MSRRVKSLSPRERSNKNHRALVRSILAELGALPGVLLAANPSREDPSHRVVGWPGKGAPDILFALAPHGELRGLEVKTGTGRLDRDQKKCHRALARFGIAVHVVGSLDEACEAVALERIVMRRRGK